MENKEISETMKKLCLKNELEKEGFKVLTTEQVREFLKNQNLQIK